MSESNGVKSDKSRNGSVEVQVGIMKNLKSVISLLPKRKNKITKNYKQFYRKAWEEVPEFKEWLAEIPGQRNLAYCKICQKTLHAHRLSLTKHTVSLKHCRLAQKKANEQQEDYYYYEDPDEPMEQSTEVEVVCGVEASSQQVLVDAFLEGDTTIQDKSSLVAEEVVVEPGGEPQVESHLQIPTTSNSTDEVSVNKPESSPSSQPSLPTASSSPETPQPKPPAVTVSSVKISSNNSSQFITIPTKTVTITAVNQLSPTNQALAQLRKSLANKPAITTHVLDTARGSPAAGLAISLYQLVDGRWTLIKDGHTNGDGRCSTLTPPGTIKPGRYKLHFDTDRYFLLHKQPTFFPFIELVFDITSPDDRNHIPLLLSPFGYTVYKGS